jgi:hypothetical protein
MSDTADNIGVRGRQLLNRSETAPLRERMQRFVDQQEEAELKRLRRKVADGRPLSEIVEENRDERL